MRRLFEPLTRMGGFSASVLLSTVIGIFAMPVLITALGPQGWASIAVLQTVGQFAAIFVAFGWGATGPALVAATPVQDRPGFFRESLRVRFVLFLIATPITAVILMLLLRGDVLLAVLGAIGYLLPGLGAGWYYTGTSRPAQFFLREALPTAMGTVIGVIAAAITQQSWVVPAAQIVGSGAAVLINRSLILRDDEQRKPERRPILTTLAQQRHAVISASTSSFYVVLPTVLVTVFAREILPVYQIADRLFRYASLAYLPIQQFFQGWVPVGEQGFRRRAMLSTYASFVTGLVGGLCIALLSPWASRLLSNNSLEVPLSVSALLGVAFVGVAVSGVVGYANLVALDASAFLARSTVIGAVVGAPLVLTGALLGSLTFVAFAVAIIEITVATIQTVHMRKLLSV